ncbi:MAG: hypothetical protein CVU41_03490 [Chloroflexi bacterium HGW-Chloroflexi-3]|nr:MAG: hypothetical protein CVU41_03490 [Chloroflexi bacterium HGW-Chloroflexi-3]
MKKQIISINFFNGMNIRYNDLDTFKVGKKSMLASVDRLLIIFIDDLNLWMKTYFGPKNAPNLMIQSIEELI